MDSGTCQQCSDGRQSQSNPILCVVFWGQQRANRLSMSRKVPMEVKQSNGIDHANLMMMTCATPRAQVNGCTGTCSVTLQHGQLANKALVVMTVLCLVGLDKLCVCNDMHSMWQRLWLSCRVVGQQVDKEQNQNSLPAREHSKAGWFCQHLPWQSG